MSHIMKVMPTTGTLDLMCKICKVCKSCKVTRQSLEPIIKEFEKRHEKCKEAQ